jgi:hypothetical protein
VNRIGGSDCSVQSCQAKFVLMNSCIPIVVVWQFDKFVVQFCLTKMDEMMKKDPMDFLANSS